MTGSAWLTPVERRLLCPTPARRAFAWGANGVTSVLGSVVSVAISWVWGISAMALVAAGVYAVAALTLLRTRDGLRLTAAG